MSSQDDSPHPDRSRLRYSTPENNQQITPEVTPKAPAAAYPGLFIPGYQQKTLATMNRERGATQDPTQPSMASTNTLGGASSYNTAKATQSQPLSQLLSQSRPLPAQRTVSSLQRESGTNDLLRAPSPGDVDGSQIPIPEHLDLSEGEADASASDEGNITVRKNRDKNRDKPKMRVAFQDTVYPSMTHGRAWAARKSSSGGKQARFDSDGPEASDSEDDLNKNAWSNSRETSPAPGVQPSRAQGPHPRFETRPSITYVIPQADDERVYDVYHNDEQGRARKGSPLTLTSIEKVQEGGPQANHLATQFNHVVAQVRDMWKDLKYERKRADQAELQLVEADQQQEDAAAELEGFKGDLDESRKEAQDANVRLVAMSKTAERHRAQADGLSSSKKEYKTKYKNEFAAHKQTQEELKKLQAELQKKRSRRGQDDPSDASSSSSSEDNEGHNRSNGRSRDNRRRRNRSSDRRDTDDDDAPRGYRRSKKPEPDAFTGNDTTTSEYLKWKMDIMDWFDEYQREFSSESKKLTYLRQKTKDRAWGSIQQGYLIEGAEFAHSK